MSSRSHSISSIARVLMAMAARMAGRTRWRGGRRQPPCGRGGSTRGWPGRGNRSHGGRTRRGEVQVTFAGKQVLVAVVTHALEVHVHDLARGTSDGFRRAFLGHVRVTDVQSDT